MNNEGILYWITGLPCAGKTTIGSQLYYRLKEENKNIILLDGDLLKTLVEESPKYTMEDRKQRAFKYSRICKALVDQGLIVICCTISMFEEVRMWNRNNNKRYVEVFLDVPMNILKQRDKRRLYETSDEYNYAKIVGQSGEVNLPKNADVVICNSGEFTLKECVDKILTVKVAKTNQITDDTLYWNAYYNKQITPIIPSSFASYITKYLEDGSKIVDLGCGNGRDSKYFGTFNLNVIGVDYAKEVIDKLQNENLNDNISYVRDDFTLTTILFQQNFDYCYSRFTLHAINEKQQENLLVNVSNSLSVGGYFFIEARSINDAIFGLGEAVVNERNAYIYDNHYRRFLVLDEITKRLEALGFTMIEAFESKGLSIYKDSDPTLIRIVAKKAQ